MIFGMVLIPIASQNTIYASVDGTYFKRVKISRFSFLFRAIEKRSVSEHGIVKSLLYVQIQGYVVALASLVFLIYSLLAGEPNSKLRFTVILSTFIIHLLVVCVIMGITGFVSNSREKKKGLSQLELLNIQLISKLLKVDEIRNKEKREEETQKIFDNDLEERIRIIKKNKETKKQSKKE